MQIEYRLAGLEDLEEICSLVQGAIASLIEQNILQWDELYPTQEDFREDIRKSQLYVGMIDGQIAVIYTLNQECDDEYMKGKWRFEDRPYYVIHRLCVNRFFQNQGIGRYTMKHIEKEVQAMGITAIRLDAFTENPYSLKMYGNLGYTRVGYVNWRKGKFYLLEKYL